MRTQLKNASMRVEAQKIRSAARALLAMTERVLGKDAGPAERMRYLTQLFLYAKDAEGPRPVDVLLACYDELFPQS